MDLKKRQMIAKQKIRNIEEAHKIGTKDYVSPNKTTYELMHSMIAEAQKRSPEVKKDKRKD